MRKYRSPVLSSTLFGALLCFLACAGEQSNAQVGPPNSVDENEQSMKEAEEVADQRQEEALEEATENVEGVEVVEENGLETDEVDTELGDQ